MMQKIKRLKNPIQEYAWGSHTAIPELLGLPSPSPAPCAELWMGAHPQAPSSVYEQGQWQPLNKLIAQNPEDLLGSEVSARFSGELPFLFKVLAAEKPLSIQAHPDKTQAAAGFARENEAGMELSALNRNYKDGHHKPECICALTPYDALCGFREISDIFSCLSQIELGSLDSISRHLKDYPDTAGLKQFLKELLTMPQASVASMVLEVVQRAEIMLEQQESGAGSIWDWIVRLNREYPGDVGVLAPTFLNLITLEPGQALFLPAGVLHSYLGGTGLEIMANSNNVLRGGLTPKHVDVPELLRVLDFSTGPPDILKPVPINNCEEVYHTAAEEFVLSAIKLLPPESYAPPRSKVIEILLCTSGQATICEEESGLSEPFNTGDSLLVPAQAGQYNLTGNAVIYKASIP